MNTARLVSRDLPLRRIGASAARQVLSAACAAGLALALALPSPGQAQGTPTAQAGVSDAVLVKELPGFRNGYADANGTRLHYVEGGSGPPLILLPGWPETWWQYHRIMPTLAKHYRVVAVDLRGMGGSARPPSGYDKKTMAADIHALARHLGFQSLYVAGHDIGSMVAFSFAANYPAMTRKLVLMDVPHPDELFGELRMLPAAGTFGDKIDDQHPGYPWWFAFHQVKGLPEQLLAGRTGIYLDFLVDYLARDSGSISARDRAVYKAAFARPGAIRSGNAYYQAFMQDALDVKTYPKLQMPVLGLAGPGYGWLQASVPGKVADFKLVKVENSGHFLAEEQPGFVARQLIEFVR